MNEQPATRRAVREARNRARRRRVLRDITVLAIACVIVTAALQAYVVRGFWVPSESMEPTLNIEDRILVDEVTPKLGGLRSGDIIVFRDPGGWAGTVDEGEQFLVKRIIGTPGDRVEGLADGTIKVNGTILEEPDVRHVPQEAFSTVIEPGHLWVMGDNRGSSSDSRYHGAVPISDVVGRVIWVYWPLGDWGAP